MIRNRNRVDCFTSVYCDRQIDSKLVDTIFVEIDASDFGEANRRACILESHLRDRHIDYRKYFSGRRGFHYYLDMPPVKLSSPGTAVGMFIKSLPQVIDANVMSGPRQMARTPYTRHSKTLLWCVPVNPGFTLQQSICPFYQECDLAENPDLPNILKEFDRVAPRPAPTQRIYNQLWPACITNALSELQETGELDHRQRLHMVAFLLRSGYSPDSIDAVFAQNAKDYKAGITRQQITHMVRTGMACYTCMNVQGMDLCPYDPTKQRFCEFYPSINYQVKYDNLE
ncbi:MAG: hypothetical protein PHI12_07805 [Dehalococcoidales bacterium]|jgi:hypothetical protein|nr:hypothetical protein [Dehalococcoidales bacterium]